MALKHFGKPENDEGVWFPFGLEAPFKLRIRRLSAGVSEKIDARHKGKSHFEVIEGIRRPIRDLEAITDGLADKAAWCLTDAEGLQIEIADQESLEFWQKSTGLDDLTVGGVVDLQGDRLTAEVKRLLIREIRPFAQEKDEETGKPADVEFGMFIIRKAGALQKGHQAAREADAGNS